MERALQRRQRGHQRQDGLVRRVAGQRRTIGSLVLWLFFAYFRCFLINRNNYNFSLLSTTNYVDKRIKTRPI